MHKLCRTATSVLCRRPLTLRLEYLPRSLSRSSSSTTNVPSSSQTSSHTSTAPNVKLDEIFEILARERSLPDLDNDDLLLKGERVVALANLHGIYRDLFGHYQVDRDDISFTQEQAERMDKYIAHYWITDLPFSRVIRHPKEPEPIKSFVPLVRVSAKFVHQIPESSEHLYAHTSYYGNHIPAKEALQKPSITLDCNLLSPKNQDTSKSTTHIQEKDFKNWTPGSVQVVNLDPHNTSQHLYSLLLLNLDYLHTENNCNIHWFAANIQANQQDQAQYDELCDYLPVHGIRGFGYSRYVFLLLQHEKPFTSQKINSFSLEARKFNLNSFMQQHSNNITPIGLSWFQTTWDESSNKVFHDYVDIKAPVYDYIQPTHAQRPQTGYPGRVPFNLYLDYCRSKKDINQQVLLERLKQIDPFVYKDQYEIPRVPPTIHPDEGIPSWLRTVMFKKKNKFGYWRGLRPASATLPLNNNADLDNPIRPVESSEKNLPEFHNQYNGRPRRKMFKDMPVSKPPSEFSETFIQDDHEIHLEKVMKMIEEANFKKTKQSQKAAKKDTTTT